MKELSMGGPDAATRLGVYTAARISDTNIRTIEQIIEGSGKRNVGSGAYGNVVSRFDSLKNKHHRVLESHTCELVCAYEMEFDAEVLGYYAQPQCVGICRTRPDGRRHVSSAHLDFIVLRRSSVELVECKQLDWLERKVMEGHPDWCLSENRWTCRPYESWAKGNGMQFKVWVGPRHPATYLRNQELIYGALRLGCTDFEERTCKRMAAIIKKRSLSIAEMRNEMPNFSSRIPLLMLARGEAYGPLKSISIQKESMFLMFSAMEQAAHYDNCAATEIMSKFVQLGELKDPLLLATSTDLAKAKNRLKRVRDIQGGRTVTPTRTLRNLARKVEEAEGKGESGLAACLTRYHASGNRVPRLADEYVGLRRRIVEEYWNRGRVETVEDACRIYEAECINLGLPLAGLTALREAIREVDPRHHAVKVAGLRGYQSVRRNTDPRFTSAAPLAYGTIAHIDSTPIDMRLVERRSGELLQLSATFYVAIDGATGYPLAYALIFGPSRTEGLAILMRQMVRRNGFLPQIIHVDRGPDNTSKWMEGFCEGRITVRYSPTAGSAWNQLAESANNYANAQVSQKLFGSTLPDRGGRSVDGKFKSTRTARMDFVEVNELIEKYVYEELAHTPGADHLSPVERRQNCLDQFGCMGAKRKLDDDLLVATSIPLGRGARLTSRGSIRTEDGIYTSRELQSGIRGRTKLADARMDCEDPAILYVRVDGVWMKAFHRRIQSVASDERLERLFEVCYAPTARRIDRGIKQLLKKQVYERIERAKKECVEDRRRRNEAENPSSERSQEKISKPDLNGPLFDDES